MAPEVTAGLIYRGGYWFPAYDSDDAMRLIHHCERNLFDMATMVRFCEKGRRRLCIQAGGHVGIWPRGLSNLFGAVLTFEPQPDAFRALMLNIEGRQKIIAHQRALSDRDGDIAMAPGADSGTWRTANEGNVIVRTVTIDSLTLPFCDAIVLDVEGSEPAALRGAERTIGKFRPVLHVEMLPRTVPEIEATMAGLGYVLGRSIHKDAIYVPK